LREIYILATEKPEPVSLDELKSEFESEQIAYQQKGEWGFQVEADGATVAVSFESVETPMGLSPDLLSGSDAAKDWLKKARGFYRFSFEPAKPQPSVAVFEALWCVRMILERTEGVVLDVTSFKLHEPADIAEITELDFDIRDHVTLHAVEAPEGAGPLWIHSHGMEKFGTRNVEVFRLSEDDLAAAESFLHELCTDLAFGQGPGPRTRIETSEGESFMFSPSEEARQNLIGVPLDLFEGHEGVFYTVVSIEGRHIAADLLAPYHERFEDEPEERTQELLDEAKSLLPAFKARYMRKGLMEPLTFLTRATFETHPEGEQQSEDLWLEVVGWDEATITGKLVDGSGSTSEWRKGATVEVDESAVNAIALGREGRALDDDEMRKLLVAERPM
jgi:hypothetical protein